MKGKIIGKYIYSDELNIPLNKSTDELKVTQDPLKKIKYLIMSDLNADN